MEASLRILNPIILNRHLQKPNSLNHNLSLPRFPNPRISPNPRNFTRIPQSSSQSTPISNPLGFLLSISSPNTFNFNAKDEWFSWHRANGGAVNKKPVVAVVLLGWLGAKRNHLRRYVDLYNARGIHAVTFVVQVSDLIGLDLGRGVERRISALSEELVLWLSEPEKDGRERNLLFHTFSNTGWFAYGAILDNLQGRHDLMHNIKGCIVDSGGDPEINPQVWAAGFSAALLKKRSFLTQPSVEDGGKKEIEREVNMSEMPEYKPLIFEPMVLVALELFFSFILKLPDVNRRLTNIISRLSNNQPSCPQLYLFSTSDKVIPARSVVKFIEDQKSKGIEVQSFDFVSSPHVDHYRTFPDLYSSALHNFLKECLDTVKQL